VCEACETFKEKSPSYLENETISEEKYTLLENFQELENKSKGLEKDLKDLNKLYDHQNVERHDMWKEYAQAHKDYEDPKISKRNLWVECEEHKIFLRFLNEKLLKNLRVNFKML